MDFFEIDPNPNYRNSSTDRVDFLFSHTDSINHWDDLSRFGSAYINLHSHDFVFFNKFYDFFPSFDCFFFGQRFLESFGDVTM